jgi:sialidase-1
VLAFCEGRVNSHKDEDDMDVVLNRSTDGGRTWGPLQVLANDGRNPCKNQCPVVLPSGRIMLVWLWNQWIRSEKERTTREVFVMHSDDDGVTWSKPRNITASVYRPDWRWYGTGPCHAIVKRSEPHEGRIVVPARHNSKGARMASHVIYSDDGGETWHIGGSVPRPQTTEATVVELSNGDLMLNSRNQNDGENHRVVSISKDGGATFTETWLEKALVEPRGCQGSLLYHSLNAATGKGNILFSNPANGEVRSDGTLKLSEDDGRTTWTRGFLYAKKPAPNFTGYSDIAVMPDGSVGILYERGDLDDARQKSERYDEIGFTVVPFAEIRTPQSAVPFKGPTP